MLSPALRRTVRNAQVNEITEHFVYQSLARIVKDRAHAEVLERVSREELAHYGFFTKILGADARPNHFKVFYYVTISRILGLNFGLKLMERGEHLAADAYAAIQKEVPHIEGIMEQEKEHERSLVDLIQEDRLKYISSVILGLNDALIELTASVAGFTLAVQNTRLIAVLGLITGVAAALSMAASEYLATKHEEQGKDPLKACFYTGLSYIVVVLVLVAPYFFLTNIFLSLVSTVGLAVLTILVFTFYTSVAQGLKFKERFLEMAGLSVVIAAFTFFLGLAVRNFFGVEI